MGILIRPHSVHHRWRSGVQGDTRRGLLCRKMGYLILHILSAAVPLLKLCCKVGHLDISGLREEYLEDLALCPLPLAMWVSMSVYTKFRHEL